MRAVTRSVLGSELLRFRVSSPSISSSARLLAPSSKPLLQSRNFASSSSSSLFESSFGRSSTEYPATLGHEPASDNNAGSPQGTAEATKVTRLKAIYTSRKIDVLSMYQKLKVGRFLEDEYLLVPLPLSSQPLTSTSNNAPQTSPGDAAATKAKRRTLAHQKAASSQQGLNEEEQDEGRHCVYFPHGAVVFFNCDDRVQRECLDTSKPFTKSPMGEEEVEEYEVEVDPNLGEWCEFAPNRLIVRTLDLKNVAVISNVLAQAVALRHFEDEIDTMLEGFEAQKKEREAVKILKDSNKVLRDVMLTLGLLDHASESSPAWQDERYHQVWTGLRDEFEIEKRWRALQTKTNFLQDNLRFAVELAHARTSERLEIAIIVLITAELAISCFNVIMGNHIH